MDEGSQYEVELELRSCSNTEGYNWDGVLVNKMDQLLILDFTSPWSPNEGHV